MFVLSAPMSSRKPFLKLFQGSLTVTTLFPLARLMLNIFNANALPGFQPRWCGWIHSKSASTVLASAAPFEEKILYGARSLVYAWKNEDFGHYHQQNSFNPTSDLHNDCVSRQSTKMGIYHTTFSAEGGCKSRASVSSVSTCLREFQVLILTSWL